MYKKNSNLASYVDGFFFSYERNLRFNPTKLKRRFT